MSGKKQLEFTARAIQNIADAEAYIAQDNLSAAQKVVESIYNTAKGLVSFPEAGRPGRVPGTRELPLPKYPYTIVYRIRASRVVIYAVLHQARKYP